MLGLLDPAERDRARRLLLIDPEFRPLRARLGGAALAANRCIQYARGADGMARKYRAMFIDGVAYYPLHVAAGADRKVHYSTSAMAADAALREEERRFLADMPGTLGPRAMAALTAVGDILGLDSAGIDFGLPRTARCCCSRRTRPWRSSRARRSHLGLSPPRHRGGVERRPGHAPAA